MPNEKTKKTKWALSLLTSLILLILLGTSLYFLTHHRQKNTLLVRGNTLTITYARTEAEKEKGLCCRKSLGANEVMLFVYDTPGDYRYWMKDTLIPLDMLWLDSNKKIVHIEHSVQPASYPKTYESPVPAQYVLETTAGYTKSHGISTGDSTLFNQ